MINTHAISGRAVWAWRIARRSTMAALSFLASGAFLAFVAIASGCGLAIAGVHILFGLGWSLLAGAVPLLATGFLILRGVIDG